MHINFLQTGIFSVQHSDPLCARRIVDRFHCFGPFVLTLFGISQDLWRTRCYPKVPEVYQKKKVDTLKVLIASILFKVGPLGAYTTIPTFCHDWKLSWKSFCVIVFSTFCDSAWISYTVSNLRPINLIFILGKRKFAFCLAASTSGRHSRTLH
jgi:hypothetical protein